MKRYRIEYMAYMQKTSSRSVRATAIVHADNIEEAIKKLKVKDTRLIYSIEEIANKGLPE